MVAAMNAHDARTDYASLFLPVAENEKSRRCLRILERWIPVGMATFEPWSGRPKCGHFFGGVLWYGQDTVMPAMTIAAACSSEEFDSDIAGFSRKELQRTVVESIRYLCFTHDTGPEDCLRPEKSWGRSEPAGTKWGERGKGFFRESQCGRQIAHLIVAATLVRDLLKEEEWHMIADIARDYLDRFESLPPQSGVFFDTQMEEDAWTALGLTACALFLEKDPRAEAWMAHAERWMFCAVSMPQDRHDFRAVDGGTTVRDFVGPICTTLPDTTAENHGFVHPSYMASSITLIGMAGVLLRLWGRKIPFHATHHHRQIYDLLKIWCDTNGIPHPPQGMDWPYFAFTAQLTLHGFANLNLQDPDAALLEGRILEVLERSSEAHEGKMVPSNTKRYCHGQQDPAIMRERMIHSIAYVYLAHRLAGEGCAPSDPADLEGRIQGVHLYDHGGAVIHVHPAGRTSVAWRNRTMVLPATPEGLRLIGHAGGSVLAVVETDGPRTPDLEIRRRIREGCDRVGVFLEQEICDCSIRRLVLAASLPDGRCVIYERLQALRDVEIRSVRQGYLSIVNDPIFGDTADLKSHRRISWSGGTLEADGYAWGDSSRDVEVEIAPEMASLPSGTAGSWVDLDGRAGVVFASRGRSVYLNRHSWEVWHAVEDDLILGLHDETRSVAGGDVVAEMALLWCPGQDARQTAVETLEVLRADGHGVVLGVAGFLCACSFGEEALGVTVPARRSGGVCVSPGLSVTARGADEIEITVAPGEPLIAELT